MRRSHYLIFILLLIAQTSFGQIYQNMAQPGYKFSRARFDSVLTIPSGLGNLKNITGGQDTGQIRFNVSDSSVYVWNGRAWIKPSGGGSGSIDYVTQGYGIKVDSSGRVYTVRVDSTIVGSKTYIDAKDAFKLNIADTAAMLTPYAKTAALAAKLNISDTASMLSNYAKTSAVNLKLNISDTSSMLSAYARSAAVTSALALKLNITDTIGNADLFIRNLTTQENKRFNVKGGRLDTLYASTSAGGRVVSNGGTIAAEWGAGGGSNFDFHGFAGYNANRASSYTARSFTDKNYVDSSLTLKTTVTSYGKNAGGDSTILVLSNGTRYAAKDSIGGGGLSWSLTGNASAVTDFLGTTNNRTMRFRTNNVERMVIDSLGNVAINSGTNAAYKLDVNGAAKFVNDIGIGTGIGGNLITIGSGNNSPIANSENTAMGAQSGSSYDNGGTRRNSSFGFRSAQRVADGYFNTLIGAYAGNFITDGFDNTAIGTNSLGTNNTSRNVAVGTSALSANTGNDNVAVGRFAGRTRATGNTDLGFAAGNAGGSYNVSLGYNAGQYASDYKFYAAAIPATNGNLLYGDFQTKQLKINNTNTPSLTASAQLEVVSTTRGFLPPRMTTSEKNAIASPVAGLVVYDTTLNKLCVYTTAWETITSL